MKSYKLNKTFENSLYPIEQELIKIRKSKSKTAIDILGNFVAVAFSGIATSFVFQENGIPSLLAAFINPQNGDRPNAVYSGWYIFLTLVFFILLFVVGLSVNKCVNREKNDLEKKKTSKGRNELAEIFHKSIINNIVTGISFSNKAKENKYQTNVEIMYLFEAVYYFKLAQIDIENMDLFDIDRIKGGDALTNQIGIDTLYSTLTVYKDGIVKVVQNLPKSKEKKEMEDIIILVDNYRDILTKKKCGP